MAKRTKSKENKTDAKSICKKIIGILSGILLIAFCISLVLSMVGYNPSDESFNVSNSEKISNFMGKFGSYSADFIVNSYGMAIYIFLIPVLVWGYLLIKHQKILEVKIRIFAVLLGIISLSGVFYQTISAPLEKINLLGKFSHLLPEALIRMFSSWKLNGYEEVLTLSLLSIIALMSFNLAAGINFKHWANGIKRVSHLIYTLSKGIYAFVNRLIHPRSLFEKVEKDTNKIVDTPKVKERKEPTLTSQMDTEKAAGKEIKKLEKKPEKAKSAEVISFTNKKIEKNNGYQYPDINLLKKPKEKLGLSVTEKELNETARALEGVLEEFGVHGEIVKIRPGPVVTLFELEPAPGTKTSRVISLADDIARSMSAVSVRIAVVPGSNTIGIEIPNSKREIVWLRDLLEDSNFIDSKNALNVVLGKDIGGKNIYADLAKMPHLLVAGTTGSGKSVGVNSMILSLLYSNPISATISFTLSKEVNSLTFIFKLSFFFS